jgi:hypothetical protein
MGDRPWMGPVGVEPFGQPAAFAVGHNPPSRFVDTYEELTPSVR